MAGDGTRGKRPFWAHQLVEYILGAALVGVGLQSPTPIVPAVLGGVVLMYTACTRGALSAFSVIDRRVHRVADPIVAAIVIGGSLQPLISVDNATRVTMIGIAVVHLVVWLGSSYTQKEKQPRDPNADRSTELGRSAGRMAAKGVRAIRTARAKRAGQ